MNSVIKRELLINVLNDESISSDGEISKDGKLISYTYSTFNGQYPDNDIEYISMSDFNKLKNKKGKEIMDHSKLIRIKDKIVFWLRTDKDGFQWLCAENKRILKPLKDVRDFEKRFRIYTIGVENDQSRRAFNNVSRRV